MYINLSRYSDQAKKGFFYSINLRKRATEYEIILKKRLKIENIKFKFQKPFSSKIEDKVFIVDFFIIYKDNKGFVVEVDGEYHNNHYQRKYDIKRESWLLKNKGIEIIRFTNKHILEDLDSVILLIKEESALMPIKIGKASMARKLKRKEDRLIKFKITESIQKLIDNKVVIVYTECGCLLTKITAHFYETTRKETTEEMRNCKHDFYIVEGSKIIKEPHINTLFCRKCSLKIYRDDKLRKLKIRKQEIIYL